MFTRTLTSRVSLNPKHTYMLRRSTSAHIRKMYDFQFDVAGTGSFPYDMLRLDRCWPVTPEYMTRSPNGRNEPRVVTLMCTANAGWQPTYERWRSFGWVVTSEETWLDKFTE